MTARVPRPKSPKKKRRDELAGRIVGGRYQLLLRLASGGMGSVYAGRAVGAGGFERRLAIKLLHEHLAEREKFVAMFLDEARLAAKIHHPNVVSTLDVFEWDDRYYLVMEYVEGLELGRLLHSALQQRDKLPVRVVLRILLDALAGLVAAHELTDNSGRPLNLVHRDISPQNILVGADGIARLTDFGVAKAEDRLHVTQGAEFKGKVAYAAPEQLEHSVVEQRSDVFAMGIILWETLTQKRLFKAKDKHGIRKMVLAGDYPLPSSVDPSLLPFDQIVEEAMAIDLRNRTSSAAALMKQVEEVATTVGGPASANDVRNWVRSLAGAHLAERAEELREAESSVPYPSSDRMSVPASSTLGAEAPPAVPEQSEVVQSLAGGDPGRDDVTRTSKPQPTDPLERRGLLAPAVQADADSFENSATRKYERPDSERSESPDVVASFQLEPLRTNPSDISVELLESEPGRDESGVEPTRRAVNSRALGRDAPFADPRAQGEPGLTTSVIEEVAARHQRLLWMGAAVMLLLAAAIVGTVIAMAASEEDEPAILEVIDDGTESVTTEVESEPESEPEPESESESETELETDTETAETSETDTAETETATGTPTALTEPLTEVPPAPRVTMRRGAMRPPATMSQAPTPPTMVAEPDMTSPNVMPDNPYRDL